MLVSNRLSGFGAGWKPLSNPVFQYSTNITTNNTSDGNSTYYTFNDIPIGEPSALRCVVVILYARFTSYNDPFAVGGERPFAWIYPKQKVNQSPLEKGPAFRYGYYSLNPYYTYDCLSTIPLLMPEGSTIDFDVRLYSFSQALSLGWGNEGYVTDATGSGAAIHVWTLEGLTNLNRRDRGYKSTGVGFNDTVANTASGDLLFSASFIPLVSTPTWTGLTTYQTSNFSDNLGDYYDYTLSSGWKIIDNDNSTQTIDMSWSPASTDYGTEFGVYQP